MRKQLAEWILAEKIADDIWLTNMNTTIGILEVEGYGRSTKIAQRVRRNCETSYELGLPPEKSSLKIEVIDDLSSLVVPKMKILYMISPVSEKKLEEIPQGVLVKSLTVNRKLSLLLCEYLKFSFPRRRTCLRLI